MTPCMTNCRRAVALVGVLGSNCCSTCRRAVAQMLEYLLQYLAMTMCMTNCHRSVALVGVRRLQKHSSSDTLSASPGGTFRTSVSSITLLEFPSLSSVVSISFSSPRSSPQLSLACSSHLSQPASSPTITHGLSSQRPSAIPRDGGLFECCSVDLVPSVGTVVVRCGTFSPTCVFVPSVGSVALQDGLAFIVSSLPCLALLLPCSSHLCLPPVPPPLSFPLPCD